MNYSEYEKNRNEIIDQYAAMTDFSWNEQLNGQFALASASLSNFLPGIDYSVHPSIFASLLTHKKLSLIEQADLNVLQDLVIDGLPPGLLNELRTRPMMICTFHLGSYRLLNLFLGTQQIPFTLVAGSELLSQEGAALTRLYKTITGEALSTIDASDARSPFRMLRHIKEGRSLVFYIDGNTGAGTSSRNNHNSCIIPLFAGHIHARKGIATLAQHAQIPILPVLALRKSWTDIRLRFFEPIITGGKPDESEAQQLTTQLYNLAAPFILQDPSQWEAWLYLHKSAYFDYPAPLIPAENPAETRYRLDRNRFSLITMGKKHFLLRKNTYTSFEIHQYLYNLLNESDKKPIMSADLQNSLLLSLKQEHVLINFKNNLTA